MRPEQRPLIRTAETDERALLLAAEAAVNACRDTPTAAQCQCILDAHQALVTGENLHRNGFAMYRSVGSPSNVRLTHLLELIAAGWKAGAAAGGARPIPAQAAAEAKPESGAESLSRADLLAAAEMVRQQRCAVCGGACVIGRRPLQFSSDGRSVWIDWTPSCPEHPVSDCEGPRGAP